MSLENRYLYSVATAHPQRMMAPTDAHFFPSVLLSLGVAALMLLTACSTAPGAADQPIPKYNAEGAPPPERMEQFYNANTGTMVYRFCVGAECPQPTPKKPIPSRRATVTEIGPDGTRTQTVQSVRARTATNAPPPVGNTSARGKDKGREVIQVNRKHAEARASETALTTSRHPPKAAAGGGPNVNDTTAQQTAAHAMEEAKKAANAPIPPLTDNLKAGASSLKTPGKAPDIPDTGTRVPAGPSA